MTDYSTDPRTVRKVSLFDRLLSKWDWIEDKTVGLRR